ncbi:hypothetical protein [Paenibacillus sp. 32352]|uniref:hypothetical protein n=1 Tax=Paenibacillus sp. 32352 TaxID=1969111 RepID=UPI0009AD9DCB|nr:hypothetical protein [Paenibacillus sp. 32352]
MNYSWFLWIKSGKSLGEICYVILEQILMDNSPFNINRKIKTTRCGLKKGGITCHKIRQANLPDPENDSFKINQKRRFIASVSVPIIKDVTSLMKFT